MPVFPPKQLSTTVIVDITVKILDLLDKDDAKPHKSPITLPQLRSNRFWNCFKIKKSKICNKVFHFYLTCCPQALISIFYIQIFLVVDKIVYKLFLNVLSKINKILLSTLIFNK